MQEIWKPIVGYEGLYEVSSFGNIFSIRLGKNLSPSYDKDGYKKVCLAKLGTLLYVKIHRLVAQAFILNNKNYKIVMHLDNNKINNNINNLKWGTSKQNTKQCWNEGRANNPFILNHPMKGKFGKDHNRSKKVYQYTLDGVFIKEWDSMMDTHRELGITVSHISMCCRGSCKSAFGFIWKFNQ